PTRPPLPGRNFAPTLEGRSQDWNDEVFIEFENVRAIRTSEWKYIERIHQRPNELYNLKTDPCERLNLYGDPDLASVQEELKKRLHDFFSRYAEPDWDLWKGGKSKSDLITGDLFGIPSGQEGRRN